MLIVWNFWYKILSFQFQVHTESSFHHKRHPGRYPGRPRTRKFRFRSKSGFKSGWWSGKSRFVRGNGSGRQHQLHIAATRGRWTSIWSSFTGTENFSVKSNIWYQKSFLNRAIYLLKFRLWKKFFLKGNSFLNQDCFLNRDSLLTWY